MSLYFSNRFKLNDCIFGHQGQDGDTRSRLGHTVKIRTQGQNWDKGQDWDTWSRLGHKVKSRTQGKD